MNVVTNVTNYMVLMLNDVSCRACGAISRAELPIHMLMVNFFALSKKAMIIRSQDLLQKLLNTYLFDIFGNVMCILLITCCTCTRCNSSLLVNKHTIRYLNIFAYDHILIVLHLRYTI